MFTCRFSDPIQTCRVCLWVWGLAICLLKGSRGGLVVVLVGIHLPRGTWPQLDGSDSLIGPAHFGPSIR